MIIDNQDALKSWLIVVLEPLCDADSSALARYVLALLKKDKPEKDLKKVMVEQLDVFLGEETTPFVVRLFDAINSEEYLQTPPLSNTKEPLVEPTLIHASTEAITTISASTVGMVKVDFEPLPASGTDLNLEMPSGSAYVDKIQSSSANHSKTKEIHSTSNHKSHEITTSAHYSVKTDPTPPSMIQPGTTNHVRSASPPRAVINANDKENQPRETRRRRASLRSRSRSRSRSLERNARRSRSRDRRLNEREKTQRQFRNKSPPAWEIGARHGTATSHDRRRGGGERRRVTNQLAGSNNEERLPRYSDPGSGGEGQRKGQRNRTNSRSQSPTTERNNRNKGSPNTMRLGGGLVGGSGRGSSLERGERHHHHTNAQTKHEGEKRQRCRDFDEKGYCVRGETCPWDHGVNPVVFEGINNSALISMSLREYNPDAPDLWTRSANPSGLVGTGVQTPAVVGGGQAGLNGPAGNINPFTGAVRPGSVIVGGFPPHLEKTTNGASGNLVADYARSAVTGVGFRSGAPMLPFAFNPSGVATPLQRELIPIPVVDANLGTGGNVGGDVGAMHQGKRRFDLEDSVAIADGPTKRKLPIGSRLGPRLPSMQNNCSLELRKVPRGLNSIAHLNNHFAKFGKIVNIQVSYDGDPEAAIVTFSAHAEANVAYRSTEAVLNNRFIKVFWHSQDPGTSAGSGSGDGNTAPMMGGGRKNSQYHLNNVPAIPTPNADSAKTTNIVSGGTSQATPAGTTSATDVPFAPVGGGATTAAANSNSTTVAATHVPPPSLRLKNNVPLRSGAAANATNTISIRKKQEEQAKAVVQLANGLRKRKQELLQSYVKQMKSALELVERCESSDPQRTNTLNTIKVLQETIDKLRKEIAIEQEQQIQAQMQQQQHSQQQQHAPPPPKKTKEQQKKELLDIELELFAQQQEGNDTTVIQKRLEELQRSLGIPPSSIGAMTMSVAGGKLPSSHFSNNRGRLSYPEGSTRVDRRPKTIVVTGFANEDADFVLSHFKNFGEITKHDVDKEIPQLILLFATRNNAEQAILRGKFFKEKRLQISWAPVINAAAPIALAGGAVNSGDKAIADISNLDENKSMTIDRVATVKSNSVGGDLGVLGSSNAAANAAISSDTLPELRLEDEEEDEESEDRSWRR